MHNDDAVVPWYDGWRPSRQEADDHAGADRWVWRLHDVHKWIAYDRETDEVVGHGGLSRTPIDDDWGQSTSSCPTSPGCVRRMRASARSRRTRTGWRSGGRCAASAGSGFASEIGKRASPTRSMCSDACRRVVHRAPQRALPGGDGAHRHALRGRDRERGTGEGEDVARDDADFAVYVLPGQRAPCHVTPGRPASGLRRRRRPPAGSA